MSEVDEVTSKYKLGKVLGQGSYGQVKLATEIATGQKVAIKFCDVAHASKKTREALFRECEIMKVLHHPYILELKEVILTPNKLCIVEEFVDHGELFQYIVQHRKVDLEIARKMFRQIAEGVAYCHSLGIVHRDLKCENILLDTDQLIVRIIDFGFAKAFESHESLRTECGSPHYTAPEIHSSRTYGPECDVWSLGCILYAMLLGHLPFDGSDAEIQASARIANYTIDGPMPDDAKDLIQRILVVNPAHRISINDVLLHPFIATESPNASPETRSSTETPVEEGTSSKGKCHKQQQ